MLAAIERLLASDDAILAGVETARRKSRSLDEAASALVSNYATASATAGAIAAAPSIVPGWGTAGAIGTLVAEMVYVLKIEVEMSLALCSLRGMNIRREHDRKLAFLLAAVWTHEVSTGRNILVDAGAASFDAIAAYSPREISKLLLRALGAIATAAAARSLGRGLLRVIPLVSVGIGAGVNYTLTRRVGRKIVLALELHGRRPTACATPPPAR